MRENREGNSVEVPQPPFDYIILKYAQKLHISYADALATPAHTMLRHLEMFRYEAEYGTPKATKVG